MTPPPPNGVSDPLPQPRYVPPPVEPVVGGVYASPRNMLLRSRQSWADHAALTKTLIIARSQGAPDPDKVIEALRVNAGVIAGTLAAYYGQGAGSAFESLLGAHLGHVDQLVRALAGGDEGTARTADAAAQANAKAMADFLASQDPSAFDRVQWRSTLRDHVAIIGQEAASVADPVAFEHWFAAARRNAETISALFFRGFYINSPSLINRSWSPFAHEALGTTFGEAARGLPGLYR